MTEHDNPYAPPNSRVSDTARLRIGKAPRQVVIATSLLWISVALSIPSLLIFLNKDSGDDDAMMDTVAIMLYGVMTVLCAALILCIGRGYNWARVVYSILVVIGMLTLIPIAGTEDSTPAEWAIGGLSVALDLGAMYFLYTRPASAWFKRRTTA